MKLISRPLNIQFFLDKLDSPPQINITLSLDSSSSFLNNPPVSIIVQIPNLTGFSYFHNFF